MIIKFAPLFVALCGILRSTDLYFRTPAIKDIGVLTLITWEHLINLAVVLPILVSNFRHYKVFDRKDFLLFILVGCGASALGILCFTEAFLYVNPALAVLMQKLQPIITISLGAILLREKISRSFVAWSLVAIISSYFAFFGLTNPFSGEWQKIAIGSTFAFLAAFFWGSGTIWGKMLLQKYSQLFVMANRFLFGAVFTLIISHMFGNGLQIDIVFSETKPVFGGIVYMALISGFVATTFFYVGLKWVNATLASILELFFPVSSVLIMWLSFNRPLTPVQIAACLVMFFAVYRVNLAHKE